MSIAKNEIEKILYKELDKEFESIKFEFIQCEKNYRTDKAIFIKDRTIFIIGRTEKTNIKKIFFINDFFPRFFVEKDENIDFIIEKKKKHIKETHSKKDGEEYNYKNLGGKKELITIVMYKTSDVQEIRDLFAKTYEGNIKFTEVFRREKEIKGYFYVPSYVLEMKTRKIIISGIEYYRISKNEITGGKLEF